MCKVYVYYTTATARQAPTSREAGAYIGEYGRVWTDGHPSADSSQADRRPSSDTVGHRPTARQGFHTHPHPHSLTLFNTS